MWLKLLSSRNGQPRKLTTFCLCCIKYYSTRSSIDIFNRQAKRLHRNRTSKLPDYKKYEYLREEVGYRVYDRVCDITRTFACCVELGAGRGYVSRHFTSDTCQLIYQCEPAEDMLAQSEVSPEVETVRVVSDEEFLPFADNSVDLVVSCLSLHWVNDLPATFRQVRQCLKPDRPLVGAMLGGDTLYELRTSLQLAEQELTGGFGPHVSPMVGAADVGMLLTQAGFSLLTVDVDDIVVGYPGINELVSDLKGMGENNASWSRKAVLRSKTLEKADQIYKEMYSVDEDGKKGISATFEVIYFIAWKPDPSQQKPLRPGSGKISLKDIDRVDEIIAEHEKKSKK